MPDKTNANSKYVTQILISNFKDKFPKYILHIKNGNIILIMLCRFGEVNNIKENDIIAPRKETTNSFILYIFTLLKFKLKYKIIALINVLYNIRMSMYIINYIHHLF